MTVYENPEVREGINVTPEHPLKEFAILLAGISTAVVVAVLLLSLLAGYLVRFIPFEREQSLLSAVEPAWQRSALTEAELQKQQYLQALADRLAAQMDWPEGMRVTVHYVDSGTVNAMATLGGHLIIFQGLIDAVPSENALAMVVAHELAHIRYRHPIVALGRGFTVMLALSSLAGVGDGVMQQWLGSVGMVTALSFSRAQEAEADADALLALHRVYGHVGGAEAFFEYVAERDRLLEPPALLSTHPGNEDRIARIQAFSAAHPAVGQPLLQPLPEGL